MNKTDKFLWKENANLFENIKRKNVEKALYCWSGKNESAIAEKERSMEVK